MRNKKIMIPFLSTILGYSYQLQLMRNDLKFVQLIMTREVNIKYCYKNREFGTRLVEYVRFIDEQKYIANKIDIVICSNWKLIKLSIRFQIRFNFSENLSKCYFNLIKD